MHTFCYKLRSIWILYDSRDDFHVTIKIHSTQNRWHFIFIPYTCCLLYKITVNIAGLENEACIRQTYCEPQCIIKYYYLTLNNALEKSDRTCYGTHNYRFARQGQMSPKWLTWNATRCGRTWLARAINFFSITSLSVIRRCALCCLQ